jgi:hypothetical protein
VAHGNPRAHRVGAADVDRSTKDGNPKMNNRKRGTAPRVLGALAAAGALGLAAPGTVASACPEHDNASGSGGQSSSGAAASAGGAQNAGGAQSAGGAQNAGGANTAGSANRTSANAQKANKATSKPAADGGQDAPNACSGNSGRLDSGPCGTDFN